MRKFLLSALLSSVILLSTSCTTFYLGRYICWNAPTNQDYERYFRGYDRDSLNTSASVSKSIVSALVGIAIADGLIRSIDDPIVRYLPELEGRGLEAITIGQLLTMSSGLKHTWGMAPWHDLVRSYYKPDIRRAALRVRAVDYATFGRLYLNGGAWQGREIVPTAWIERTTEPVPFLEQIPDYYAGEEDAVAAAFFAGDGYYRHHWWGYQTGPGTYDFFTLGILGQFIYVSPKNRVIIVRMAEDWGAVDWWPAVFRDLAAGLGE